MKLTHVIRYNASTDPEFFRNNVTFCVVDPTGDDDYNKFKLFAFEEEGGQVKKYELQVANRMAARCLERDLTFDTQFGPICTGGAGRATWHDTIPLEILSPDDFEFVDEELRQKN
jgi:hypothetical protein